MPYFKWLILGDGRKNVFFDSNYHSNVPDGGRRCENPYGNFSTIEDALKECEIDSFCSLVYNENCVDSNGFKLCNKLEHTVTSPTRSCIYTKSKKD